MKLDMSKSEEVKQQILTEKSYIEFIREIDYQVELALEYIEYAIECKTNRFIAFNEEQYSKIEIPIRNILLFLLNTYQTAQKNHPMNLLKID